MLSKAQSKHIRSLTQQKFRKEHQQFIAEGHKVALEYLNSSAAIVTIVATNDWIHENIKSISRQPNAQVIVAEQHEIDNISALQTPGPVLLVVSYPVEMIIRPQQQWYLALDDIQDPGNMGTLIRIADWFGIKEILCSAGCVDVYNPKVIQAAMGSHLRVRAHTAILPEVLPDLGVPIYAANLQGTNIYTVQPQPASAGVIVIGNESKGISQALTNVATHQITIPCMGGAESLNAGVSAGIICALLIGKGH